MNHRLTRLLLALLPAFALSLYPLVALPEDGATGEQFDESLWGINLKGSDYTPRDEGDLIRLGFGWPRTIPHDVPLWGRSPALMDLDRNGDVEIGIVSGDGRLAVLQHDGANYPGFPLAQYQGDRADAWINPTNPVPCAISDIDRDELAEFLYITDIGYVHAVNVHHAEPRLFPFDAGRNGRFSPVVANDFNGDQQSEIVYASSSRRPEDQDSLARIHILRGDATEVAGWPVQYGYFSASSPSIGDIDGDGGAEIIIGSSRHGATPGQIHALRIDGTRQNGFPAGDFETIGGAPTLVDLNNDDRLEILFFARERDGARQGLYALNGTGQLLNGYPLVTTGGHPYGSPAVGGSGPNGALQIAFGTFDPDSGASIELFNLDGTRVEGFPIRLQNSSAVVGSVIMADVTGDGISEVIAALAPGVAESGWIGAWTSDGEMAEDFPISLDYYGGRAFASSPTAGNIYGNGHTSLVCATTDGYVFVWTTPGWFVGDVWPTEKGGFHRLGVKPARILNAVGREPEVLPPSICSVSVSPNPFNQTAVINLQATPGSMTNIALYDAQGRLVKSLYSGRLEGNQSHHQVQLNADGLATGLYLLKWESGISRGAEKLVYLP